MHEFQPQKEVATLTPNQDIYMIRHSIITLAMLMQATRSSELDFTPAVFNDSLLSIESYLQAHNKQLSDFPHMPCPDHSAQAGLPSRLMQVELAFELPALSNQVEVFEQQSNKDQRAVYDSVLDALTQVRPEVSNRILCMLSKLCKCMQLSTLICCAHMQ